jgi:hypothetical protein
VSLRQVERQLRPAVYLGPLVETAGADKPIIVLEGDAPFGQLARRPTAQRPLDHRSDLIQSNPSDFFFTRHVVPASLRLELLRKEVSAQAPLKFPFARAFPAGSLHNVE